MKRNFEEMSIKMCLEMELQSSVCWGVRYRRVLLNDDEDEKLYDGYR